MVSKETIAEALPPFKDQRVLLIDRQDTKDIVREILRAHKEYMSDYDSIYHYFDTGNIDDTSRQLFEFLKRNVPYTKESGDYQTVKSPSAILEDGEQVDCKNYSLFIAGVLDAIKRNTGDAWDWTYRFASYCDDPEPGHVFVVVKDHGKELWIDPVFTHYNERKMPNFEVDKKPKGIGGLYAISGPNDDAQPGGTVTVDADMAIKNFLVAVNLNLFSLKDLLLSDTNVLNGPVKLMFIQNNWPFDTLLKLLNV